MKLVNWDPFDSLSMAPFSANDLFNDYFNTRACGTKLSTTIQPAVDIHEDEQAWYLDAELPGLAKEDIKVNVENHVLTIEGEKRSSDEKKEKGIHKLERRYGTFSRSFTLPETANTDKVSAGFKNGLLTLTIQKKEAAKPKEIKVVNLQ